MVKSAIGWAFHAVSVTFYLGTLAWCGVAGHAPIEGARMPRCRRCFERCDEVVS
jgi:hypothetical protein